VSAPEQLAQLDPRVDLRDPALVVIDSSARSRGR
jgi:hypothetical protein